MGFQWCNGTCHWNIGYGIREVGKSSWNEREIGKFPFSWKVKGEVGKFFLKLESFSAVRKFLPNFVTNQTLTRAKN